MKKVLFVCSGGMSSAIVEKALKAEADKAGVELEANAVGSGEAQDAIAGNDWDIVLVAPQVRNRFNTFKEYADAKGIRIENIPPRDYSPLGGKHLLDLIQK
ncbi:PTS sugar transporter subunit IIB [Lacticaseibacillus absianus]|uniref:PTS sugar transporter subunit IIB n=1 Tax=Lacticaseibacillus absianus TaxID=2729623 RepID=UPI0015C70647|nr:PTS sugar transporter subunit IIB [Lacticaseibacillus absianus]